MKKTINWSIKALAAGLAAFALLCLLCTFYFNIPVRAENPDGATEYKYEADRRFYRGTEGFGCGRVNNDGFNNALDYSPERPIDLLLLGSSHTEGFCVPQQNTAAAALNRLYGGEKYAYSVGMAGHTFLYCAKRLEAALDTYRPRDAAVIELATLSYDPAAMEAALDGSLPDMPVHSGGLLTALQKIPYLRLLYTKYVKNSNEAVQAAAGTDGPVSADAYEAALSRLLQRLADLSERHGVKLILVYMPTVIMEENGNLVTDARPGERETFQRLCAEKNLLFLDLTQRYLDAARVDRRLPFGFANTAPGAGHVNSLGLRLYAEAVYESLSEQEG